MFPVPLINNFAWLHIYVPTDFCYINRASRNYCDASNRQWPSVPGKKCYGHGPLQISWNYNYGPAGKVIGFDGLGNPDKVAQNPVISFKPVVLVWSRFLSVVFGYLGSR